MSKTKKMKPRFLFTISFLFLVLFSTSTYCAWTEQQIRDILIKRIDVDKKSVGMVVGYLDGEKSTIVGYGAFSKADERVPDGKTLYEIGSISKVFTATLLADMVSREQVGIDDPVQQYLPESVTLPTWEEEPFTLYHLTTQTSGLTRMPDNFNPADPRNPYADYSVEDMYEFLGYTKLQTRPGETALYSNLGVGLLGHVLALQAEMDYEELAIEQIAEPLGMHDTVITLTPELAARMAQGHNAQLNPTSNWDIPTFAGAGALRSTATDMLIFLKANLADKETSPLSALQDTHTPNEPMGSSQIGMGWIIREANEKTIHWHNGGTGGFRTFAGFDHAAGTAVVVLSNASNSPDDIGFHLLDPASELTTFKSKDKAIQVSNEVLDKLSGEYALTPDFILKFWREDEKFFVQATGQRVLRLHAESETNFFVTEVEASFTFGMDEQGEVVHVVLHQGGANQKASRMGTESGD